MNKEESLALYNKGREAWNAWAKEMLSQQETDDPPKGANLESQNWVTRAAADFYGHTFKTDPDFSGFLFPGVATFTTTKFKKEASFAGATFSSEVRFEGATFRGHAWFWEVTFGGDAWFHGTRFSSNADFLKATFSGIPGFWDARFSDEACFEGATFSSEAWFEGAKFEREALFEGATFSSEARFERATFSDDTIFYGATFEGDAGFGKATFSGKAEFEEVEFQGQATFSQAIFEGFANFSKTIFWKEANFVAIKDQSSFTLQEARFSVVPDFRQAHFEEAPQLDDVRFNHSKPRLLRGQDTVNVKENVTARWRALKRIAVQAQDHESELIFLAEEIKSLRGVRDWPLPNPLMFRKDEPVCWPGGGRYWFGLLYQWFSDFGRSTFRPFLCWMIVTGLFALFYFDYSAALNLSNGSKPPLSIGVPICDPPIDALYLSIHNGLIISGLGHGEKLTQSYACLYGHSGKNQLIPVMPNLVVLAGIGQTIVSAVLIFLFLLALRNYFRIK
jgi:uncharacterized protein YjbI with pentapeptide repeats